jgi:hypothetical protein
LFHTDNSNIDVFLRTGVFLRKEYQDWRIIRIVLYLSKSIAHVRIGRKHKNINQGFNIKG